MKAFIVSQKILSIGATYTVTLPDSDNVLYTIRGKILTFTPLLEMKSGTEGPLIRILRGNFFKTRFSVESPDGIEEAAIQFPFVALFKRFTLTIGDMEYNAKGSITAWDFNCTDETGNSIFSITKKFAYRDKFTVTVHETIPEEDIILVAVAVDQKFFTQR